MLNPKYFFLNMIKRILLLNLGLLFLLAAPHIYRLKILGGSYTTLLISQLGSTNQSWEETYAYASQANRIKQNQPINDSYIYESKNMPSPFISEVLPSIILGLPAKIIGLPLTFVATEIVSPVLILTLLVLIGLNIGVPEMVAIPAAFAATFLPKLFPLFPYSEIISYVRDPALEVQRIFHPGISLAIVLISIYFLMKVFNSPKSLKQQLLSGIALGSLFYTYLFAWTLIWGALGLLILTFLIQKEFDNLKRIILPSILGLAVAVPFLLMNIFFSKTIFLSDFMARSVLKPSGISFIFEVRYLFLIIVLMILNKNWFFSVKRRILVLLILTALILPIVSQLFTGLNIEADHWIVRFLYPTSSFLGTILIYEIYKRYKFPKVKLILGIVLIISLLKISISTYTEVGKNPNEFTLGNERKMLYSWMSENIFKNSVIGSLSLKEEIYLAAYTPYYPYIPKGERSLIPSQEITQRYANLMKIFQPQKNILIDAFKIPGQINESPLSKIDEIDDNFAALFSLQFHYDKFPFPQHVEVINKLSKYDTYPKIGRLDYLLVGPLEQTESDLSNLRACKMIYQNANYKIYNFHTCETSLFQY